MPGADDEVLDTAGAATLLHFCEETVKRKARRGLIPGTKLGGGQWRFSKAALLQLLEPATQAASASPTLGRQHPLALVLARPVFAIPRPRKTRRTAAQERRRAQTEPALRAQREKRQQRAREEAARSPGGAVEDFLRLRRTRANGKEVGHGE